MTRLTGCLLLLIAAPPIALALTPISTDTTINDATYAGEGIEVTQGAASTTVQIQPGAQIGAETLPQGIGTLDTSVLARDDSHVQVSGGTLDGAFLLQDTAQLTVTGAPTILYHTGVEVDGTANTIVCSGATITKDIDLNAGTPSVTMHGGSVLTRDFIDINTYQPGQFSTVHISNITTAERDFIDFYGRGSVTLTNVSTGYDAIQAREAVDATGSTVTWTGGSVDSDDGTPTGESDALDIYWDMVVDVDGVNLKGVDAMDGNNTSVSTLSNLTITGRDAVDAYGSSEITLNNVTIIGDDAVEAFGDTTILLNDVHVDGDDATHAKHNGTLTLRNVTLTNPGTAAVDGHQVYAEGTSIITVVGRDFTIDGVPIGPGDVAATAGRLVVTNLDGTTFDGYFRRDATATVRLEVPEPCSAALLIDGSVAGAWMRRRSRMRR